MVENNLFLRENKIPSGRNRTNSAVQSKSTLILRSAL